MQGSNLRLLACEASALPLSSSRETISCRTESTDKTPGFVTRPSLQDKQSKSTTEKIRQDFL